MFPKPHKYNAKKTVIDGESFPSGLEARTWAYLKFQQNQGLLTELTRKATVHFELIDLTYKADMKYTDPGGVSRWVEAKGAETDRWRIIKKIWAAIGPGALDVYKANSRGIYLAETIIPKTPNELR